MIIEPSQKAWEVEAIRSGKRKAERGRRHIMGVLLRTGNP
jgi:hypothetical protein